MIVLHLDLFKLGVVAILLVSFLGYWGWLCWTHRKRRK